LDKNGIYNRKWQKENKGKEKWEKSNDKTKKQTEYERR
jgi:hypothetical protein